MFGYDLPLQVLVMWTSGAGSFSAEMKTWITTCLETSAYWQVAAANYRRPALIFCTIFRYHFFSRKLLLRFRWAKLLLQNQLHPCMVWVSFLFCVWNNLSWIVNQETAENPWINSVLMLNVCNVNVYGTFISSTKPNFQSIYNQP